MTPNSLQITLWFNPQNDCGNAIIKNGKRVGMEEPKDPKKWRVMEVLNSTHYEVGSYLSKSEVNSLCKGSKWTVRIVHVSMLPNGEDGHWR